MFAKAFAIAAGYTRPVVVSSRRVNGDCQSSVGAYVIINREGWFLTAAHLFGVIEQQSAAVQTYRKYRGDVRSMDHDMASKQLYRKKKIRHFEVPRPESVRDHSTWWGMDGVEVRDVQVAAAADLALGRLEPFDPASVTHYPVFKTPGNDYLPGRSLCRLGFPFHEIVPSYDEQKGVFALPRDAVPLPLFPLEGMLTRILIARSPALPSKGPADENSLFIETSSPGLRGQSGGPIFDSEGVVWGLQSHTRHYPLGFAPHVPGRGHVEEQFLNVGVGVHAQPILQLLQQFGVEHRTTE